MCKQHGHWDKISRVSKLRIFNAENMLVMSGGGGGGGEAGTGSGKSSAGCWEHRNGEAEKPAARLGCVGEEGAGLDQKHVTCV